MVSAGCELVILPLTISLQGTDSSEHVEVPFSPSSWCLGIDPVSKVRFLVLLTEPTPFMISVFPASGEVDWYLLNVIPLRGLTSFFS